MTLWIDRSIDRKVNNVRLSMGGLFFFWPSCSSDKNLRLIVIAAGSPYEYVLFAANQY